MEELERILQTPTKNRRGSFLISKKYDQTSTNIQPSSDQHQPSTKLEHPISKEFFLCSPQNKNLLCSEKVKTPQFNENFLEDHKPASAPQIKLESLFPDDFDAIYKLNLSEEIEDSFMFDRKFHSRPEID